MAAEHTDEELMLKYKDGDAAAFEILYQRHRGGLYRYILRQCGEHIADELFQDVWMKLINAHERYEVKAKFKTYLYQVATNRIIDHFRKHKLRRKVIMMNNDDEQNEIPAREQDQPENRVEHINMAETLLHHLEKLPAEQKQVFLLREEAEMSLDEIAQAVGVNRETAKSRLRYGIKKLRDAMGEIA